MPFVIVAAAAALVGAAVTYKTSDRAAAVLDRAVELAERIEKPAIVLGALATAYFVFHRRK